jgi:microcin C transport system ATP-binding protein
MIAMALANEPDLLTANEPTSALDMSIQAQIVELLRDLQARHGLTYLFISHDLKVVRALAHELLVKKDGRIIEHGPAVRVFTDPQTHYTRQLLSAALELTTAG